MRNMKDTAMPNIYHLTSHYPPHVGGMENVIQQLASRQATSEKVTVITSGIGAEDLPPVSTEKKVTVYRLPTTIIANTPFMRGLFKRLLGLPRKSILHVHIVQALMPETAFIAAKIRGLQLVSHFHSDIGASGPLGVILPLYKKIFWGTILRHSDKVIVPTPSYKKLVAERFHVEPEKIYIIPAGVDDIFTKEERQTFRLRPVQKPLQLLFVGRLCVEKNVDLIIKAVSHLKMPVCLTIVGDGPLLSQLKEQARTITDASHRFVFLGRKSGIDLKKIYLSSDILLLASSYESQSLVAVEALCCRVPVVFTPLPAVAEVVEDAGVQTTRESTAIANTISDIYNSPAVYQKLQKACARRSPFFSWDKTIKDMKHCYTDELAQ